MARSINQIMSLMLAAHQAEPGLAPLNNTSATSRFRLFYYVVAATIYASEVLMDRLKGEVEAIRDAAVPGTVEWYRLKAFDWQNGHAVVMVAGKPGYAVDDPAARLVARSAVLELPTGGLIIKLAKASGSTLSALSSTELASIAGFYREIHFAGTAVSVLSQNADLFKVSASVYHDGTLSVATVATAIDAVLEAYLGSRPFNGRIRYAEVLQTMMSAPGVTDVTNLQVSVDAGAGHVPIGREYQPQSGWFELDSSSPTISNVTWVADVQL